MNDSRRLAGPDEVRPRQRSSTVRLILLAVIVGGGLMALFAGIPWLVLMTPRWLARGAAIYFLWALLALYALMLPAAVVGGCFSWLAAARARKRKDRPATLRAMRGLLLASTCLIGLIAMELVSGASVRWSYQIPELPYHFAAATSQQPSPRTLAPAVKTDRTASTTAPSAPGAANEISLVVVGESSALGEPYQPWVSVAQIVAWQLERVFPDRTVAVDFRARGGFTLGQAMELLTTLEHRPDAIIVFSGHNEIQTRFGYARNVRHYNEEGLENPLALLEVARALSSTATLILDTLDRFYGEAPPPPGVVRELVDHPICTPREYADTRQQFERRVEAIAHYCDSIKAVPILIVPGSNDGSFEPNRSVLTGSTPVAERAEFARSFRKARAAEASDPGAAIADYGRLIASHPEFAECHFRLARLLAGAGNWEEASRHFDKARDLDASPLRCQSDFRDAIRAVARRHGAILVDAPEILARKSAHGILDDQFYQDAHHMNLIGTIALAQDILDQLKARRAFGWPPSVSLAPIETADCVQHFKLDRAKWAKVCERCSDWFGHAAPLRYDPLERQHLIEQYGNAARELKMGHPLPSTIPPNLIPLKSIIDPPATSANLQAPDVIRQENDAL